MSTAGKMVLAAGFCLAVFVVVAFLMLNAAMGDCADESRCISEQTRAIMFWASPICGLVAILLFKRWLDRQP